MRGVGSDGLGAKGGVACSGLLPFTPPSGRGGSRQGGWEKPRGPTQGDTRRLPWGVLARGITDGFVIGQYRHAAQHSAVTPKGIWDLTSAIFQGMDQECPWTQLFIAHEYHPHPDRKFGGRGSRPPTTWRRPPQGIACIQRYNRWPGRNPMVEKAVRHAMQHRD